MPIVNAIPGFNLRLPDPNHILRANPGNPVSLARASTTIQTEAQSTMAGAQAANIASILGGVGDPNFLRHLMFQASAVIGLMWNIFSYAIQQQQSNKEANKETHNLALAAR